MRIEVKDPDKWHKFFVLCPRKIGNTWVWLETIYRRRTFACAYGELWDYTWEAK